MEKKTRKDKIELAAMACAGAAIVIWAGFSVGNKVKTTISAKTYNVGTGAFYNHMSDVEKNVMTEFETESPQMESQANSEEEKAEKEEKKEKEEKEETEDVQKK